MTDVLNITKNSFAIDIEKLAASLSTIPVGVKRLTDTAILPAFATAGAACFDLHADLKSEDGCEQIIFSYEHVFRTGLAFDIPKGYALMVYSRSGHGFKNDVRLANCVGVIDSDYTGEVKLKLTIDHNGSFTVSHGDRIAQAMLIKVPCVQLVEVDELKTTERGANGFGSTGVVYRKQDMRPFINGHELYINSDPDAPERIKDRNGEIALHQCRVCGAAEIELEVHCSGNHNVVTEEEEAATHPIMTSRYLK